MEKARVSAVNRGLFMLEEMGIVVHRFASSGHFELSRIPALPAIHTTLAFGAHSAAANETPSISWISSYHAMAPLNRAAMAQWAVPGVELCSGISHLRGITDAVASRPVILALPGANPFNPDAAGATVALRNGCNALFWSPSALWVCRLLRSLLHIQITCYPMNFWPPFPPQTSPITLIGRPFPAIPLLLTAPGAGGNSP